MSVILITGATDGIGKQTALILARQGHELILHGRSQHKLDQTCEQLEDLSGKRIFDRVLADLSDLEQVRQLAKDILERHERLDVLLNNAGVFMREYKTSPQGFELTLAINHLAPFLLTHLLLDRLKAQPAARVVNVSSIAHSRGKIDFDDLNMSQRFDGYRAYAQSKLANVLFTVALAKRLEGSNVTANSLHPGVVSTKLLTEGFGFEGSDSLDDGAQTSVYLATADEGAQVSGEYFIDSKRTKMSSLAEDEALVERFYQVSAELVGL